MVVLLLHQKRSAEKLLLRALLEFSIEQPEKDEKHFMGKKHLNYSETLSLEVSWIFRNVLLEFVSKFKLIRFEKNAIPYHSICTTLTDNFGMF